METTMKCAEQMARTMAHARVVEQIGLEDLEQECRARGIPLSADKPYMQRNLSEAIAMEYIGASGANMEILKICYDRHNQPKEEGAA